MVAGRLLSAARTPRYNGNCEAGIESMRRRTHIEAARHDDDVMARAVEIEIESMEE